jgi:Domain of unknown function (DUF4190)
MSDNAQSPGPKPTGSLWAAQQPQQSHDAPPQYAPPQPHQYAPPQPQQYPPPTFAPQPPQPAPTVYYPPPAYVAYPAPVPAPARSTNGMAIASLVLGLLWLYGVGSILAIVFGHVAMSQIDGSNATQSGRGMALAGAILGYIGAAVTVLLLIVAASL